MWTGLLSGLLRVVGWLLRPADWLADRAFREAVRRRDDWKGEFSAPPSEPVDLQAYRRATAAARRRVLESAPSETGGVAVLRDGADRPRPNPWLVEDTGASPDRVRS